MKQVTIEISHDVVSKYKDLTVGYLVADKLSAIKATAITEEIKQLPKKRMVTDQLTIQNLVEHPTIKAWREVYINCNVKPKTYKSSIESLMRRFIENDYKSIMPTVDLYNYVSGGMMVSAGGYNWQELVGKLSLRFGQENDYFIQLNGKTDLPVQNNHIVYADDNAPDNIVCWQWNHKDGRRTSLNLEVERGLFIFDSVLLEDRERVSEAVELMNKLLSSNGAEILSSGILSENHPVLII